MNAKIFAASLLALSSVCGAARAADVGLSLSVGQPGFYGRLDIGDYPPPQLLYRQPVLVERPVRYVEAAPIYLRVPPGHARDWSRHCHAYHACNQRVFFVQDGWYHNTYVPRYRERHGGHREEFRHERGHGGYDRGHDRGHERGPEHGPERGHGGEHGHGHGRHD